MRRVWTVLLACYTVAVPVVAVLAGLGVTSGWPLCGEVPFGVLLWVAWFRWRTEFGRPRPDYALIAELERELLGVEPTSLVERFANPDLIQKPKRKKPPRPYPTRGGYMSSDRTIHDLGPFPEAWIQKPVPPPGRGAGSPTGK